MSSECYETIRQSEMRNYLIVKEKYLRFKKLRKQQRALNKVGKNLLLFFILSTEIINIFVKSL